ncbi:MAG TPA: hypothetical protein VMD56_06725 [Steroidobacteraceae bacterium]|nr:hypothetical protein [Steroidobacteraceae bacterium]
MADLAIRIVNQDELLGAWRAFEVSRRSARGLGLDAAVLAVDQLVLFSYSISQFRQAVSPFVLVADVSDPVRAQAHRACLPERCRRTDNTQSWGVGQFYLSRCTK